MAGLIAEVRGHDHVIERLSAAINADRLGPVQIFAGPSGIGKRLVARGLAQRLLCDQGLGCGVCPSCRRVAANEHEGLLTITSGTSPLTNSSSPIKVDQAQKIIEFLRLRSWSRNRAVLIDDAALMTLPAANSLLKALEEPFTGTTFFLITAQPFAILPTVRSRAQWVRFQPLSREDLQRLAPTTEDWILRAAAGQMDRLQALSEEDSAHLRRQAFTVLKHVLHRELPESREALGNAVTSNDDALLVVRLWIQFLRDAVVGQVSGERIHDDLWQTSVVDRPRSSLYRLFQNLLRMEQDLLHHIDRHLVFETFIFNSCLGAQS
jgi:DNA polymerase-3 subunit delta'